MAYKGSWNPESEREFMTWLQTGARKEGEVKSCEKLLIPLRKGIYDSGAEPGSKPCAPPVRRPNGNLVRIYCEIKDFVYARCVAIDDISQEYRLLIIGPFHKRDLINVARRRAEKW